MANEQNLIQFDEMDEARRREISSNGGKASGVARRKAKNMREAARILLSAPLLDDEETAALLGRLGLDADQQSAILLAAIDKAKRGDIEAARYARDTSGQAPAQQVDIGLGDKKPEEMDLSGMTEEQLQQLIQGAQSPENGG